MTESEFNKIVFNAVKHGNKYREEIDKLSDWVQKEYGCNWSELDCDGIIDALEFGTGYLSIITFDEFKKEIEENI